MIDSLETEANGPQDSSLELSVPLEQQRETAWQDYLNNFDPNATSLIQQVMHDPQVQPWAKIKAMDSLLAPSIHPDFRPLGGIDAEKHDSVGSFRSWIDHVGIEEAEHMAQKIPQYMQSVKEAIDHEPTRTSFQSLNLQEKLSIYFMIIPTVVRKLQNQNPEKAEELFVLMDTIDPEVTDDEGKVQSEHVLQTFGDHLLQEKWKRMMANRIHKTIDAAHGRDNLAVLVKEYAHVFDMLLGEIDAGVESPISKTFFEDEINYLLEVGNQRSGIGLRHTMAALELLKDNPELAHQFARGQILPEKNLHWFRSQSDKYSVRDLVKIADMFPNDEELVQRIRNLEADLNKADEEHRASMDEDEIILDRLKQP